MQTKPIRGTTGADITEATLQITVDNIGLDKTVSQLSYAEKRLVTIISLTDQLNASINDMSRTIESPSNQLRIMNEQWERLSRAVGNVFLPILSKILPYLNAILMVMTEIISLIASLVGYKKEDFDYFAGASGDAYDMADGIGEAAENAKKLKQGLRGFDKLNVITTPSSSGASGGASGGVDPKIQEAFNEAYQRYQDMLTETEMKATRIRDRFMEWLGFSKEINDETGDISFKFDHITGGTVLGALAVGGSIFLGIKKIVGFFTTISKLTGGSSGGGLLKLLSGGSAGTILAVAAAVGILVYAIYDLYQKNDEFAASFDEKWKGIQEAVAPVIDSLGELFGTLITYFNETLKPMLEEAWAIIQTTASVLLDILYPVFTEFIIPVINTIIKIIGDVISIVNEFWNEYGKPISEAIQKAIERIGEIFEKLWVQVLQPVIKLIMEKVNDLWDNTLKPIFKKVGEIIGELIELVLALWNNVLSPVVKWLIDTLGPIVEAVINGIVNVVHWLAKTIGGIINGILDVIKGIIKFLTGVFTGDWKKAWEGIKDIFKGIINGIISIAEGMVNGVIKLINLAIKGIFNGIKSLVNKVLSTVDNIAEILGFDVDLTLKGSAPQISEVNIPRLEKGMNFVPRDFFGPVFLDYGERVLTKEQNQQYTSNINPSQEAGKLTSINPTFIIQVGDKEIARQVITDLQDMAKTNGKAITIGG